MSSSKVKLFSPEAKYTIGFAKEIALELGTTKISTIHLFIANCKMDCNYNPTKFLFQSEAEFEAFYASQKVGEPLSYTTAFLTEEAEKALRQSLELKRKIKSKKVEPIHLLLAAAKDENSMFYSICIHKHDCYQQLFEFYRQQGSITCNESTSFLKRILANLFKSKA